MMSQLNEFIQGIPSETKRNDAIELLKILEEESGYMPYISGSIVGFGSYHYKYDSGREGDSFVVAFSPRKANIAIYIMPGFSTFEEQLKRLGKHKTGKSCLYINKLKDVDILTLRQIISESVNIMQTRYTCSAQPD